MAHMCVKLSPLSLEWPQSTGTKCMLSHDHVFVAPVLEFYLLGERESVLLSTHTTQAHPRNRGRPRVRPHSEGLLRNTRQRPRLRTRP